VLINRFWPANPCIPTVLPDFPCGFRFACVTNPHTHGDSYGNANPNIH